MFSNDLLSLLLDLGTEKVQHAQGSFLSHLKGTASLLESWGNPEELVHAGLFHSVYGTRDFEIASMGYEKRDKLRGKIGDKSEYLVYLFSVCDRRSFFSNLSRLKTGETLTVFDEVHQQQVEVSEDILKNLFELEVANLLDQAPPRKELPDSTKYTMLGVSSSLKNIVSTEASIAMEKYLLG